MDLTRKERLILWNQYSILEALYPEEAEHYEGCKTRWGMKEHVELLEEQGLPVPPKATKPTVLIQNEERAA